VGPNYQKLTTSLRAVVQQHRLTITSTRCKKSKNNHQHHAHRAGLAHQLPSTAPSLRHSGESYIYGGRRATPGSQGAWAPSHEPMMDGGTELPRAALYAEQVAAMSQQRQEHMSHTRRRQQSEHTTGAPARKKSCATHRPPASSVLAE
jgi:hypothetical protein